MRRFLVTCFAALIGLAGWASPASAGLFSATGPVIVILAGDLFLGQATGYLDGSGTMTIQSRSPPYVNCRGQSTSSSELGGVGDMQCTDGVTATFQFLRLSRASGYGTGSSDRGSISFTYGLSPDESGPYLKLPEGKALRLIGKDLTLVEATTSRPTMLRVSAYMATAPKDAPVGWKCCPAHVRHRTEAPEDRKHAVKHEQPPSPTKNDRTSYV
ncbi:MAG: hypothetical protein M0Q22_04605 [Sulfuritalea sp.]|jgi:hypothetical protein|nr:hypothetical protein [Sulfuritalea sp.]